MTTPIHVAHPGSRLDRHYNAEWSAIPDENAVQVAQDNLAQPTTGLEPVTVQGSVVTRKAESAVYRTLVVSSNAVYQILPQDPMRYKATILPIDGDIILCDSKELAQNANNVGSTPAQPQGFYLSKGVSLVLENRAVCFAVTPSQSPNRISVVIERYENPAPFSQR